MSLQIHDEPTVANILPFILAPCDIIMLADYPKRVGVRYKDMWIPRSGDSETQTGQSEEASNHEHVRVVDSGKSLIKW